jgi:hypothetical protein
MHCDTSIHLAFRGMLASDWRVETSQIYLQSLESINTSALNSKTAATNLPITMLLLWHMTKDELYHVNPLKQACS